VPFFYFISFVFYKKSSIYRKLPYIESGYLKQARRSRATMLTYYALARATTPSNYLLIIYKKSFFVNRIYKNKKEKVAKENRTKGLF